MSSLSARAWFKLVALAIVMGLLLFASAGTLDYREAWVYLGIFVGASALITLDLMKRDPALLERRMAGGPTAEKRPAQRLIMLFASAGFVALLVVSALDHRFGWSTMSTAFVVIGDALVATGFYFILLVYRENTFTAATVVVAADQKVISTGPYALVRHPMYASAFLYVLGTPLALRSLWGLVPVGVMLILLIWRLLDEERLLAQELPGYCDYQKRVRFRLVPFLW